MYAMVLNKLDLQPGHAFLNVGSGSGYLSCLASCLLGESGVSHGVEINPALFEFSKTACKRWFDGILKRRADGEDVPEVSKERVQLMCGNAFDIDVPSASASCKYDRIYIGAGCPEAHKEYFFSLLANDGLIVVPIDEAGKLLAIRRVLGSVYSTTVVADVHFAPLQAIPPSSALTARDGTHALIKLPPVTWAPTKSRHAQFPPTFRLAASLLILSNRFSSAKRTQDGTRCMCPLLPTAIWMYVLSFCSRDWFVPVPTPLALLGAELEAERSMRLTAEAALGAALAARKAAERERDVLRLVVAQMRREAQQNGGGALGLLHGLFNGLDGAHSDDEDDEDEDESESEDEDGEEEEEEDEEEDIELGDEDADDEDETESAEELSDEEDQEGDEEEDNDEVDEEEAMALASELDEPPALSELEQAIAATLALASGARAASAWESRDRGESFAETERESFMSDASSFSRGDADGEGGHGNGHGNGNGNGNGFCLTGIVGGAEGADLDSIFEGAMGGLGEGDEDEDEDEGAGMDLSSEPRLASLTEAAPSLKQQQQQQQQQTQQKSTDELAQPPRPPVLLLKHY